MRLRGEAWLVAGLALAVAGCDDFKPKAKTPSSPPVASAAKARGGRSRLCGPLWIDRTRTATASDRGGADPGARPATNAGLPRAASVRAPGQGDRRRRLLATITSAQGRRDLLVRVQVILDRAHFSPGVIDGYVGGNFSRALAAFEAAHNLPSIAGRASLNDVVWKALAAADGAPVTQDYVITADDVKGPFLGTVPTDMIALSQLPHLGYASPVQALAEKFHMDPSLLVALNPDADFSAAGTSIVVVRPNAAALPSVDRVVVDKTHNEVLAYGADGKVVARFPATVGSTERPAPTGTSSVKAVVFNPDYTYDPKRLTFGDRSVGVLTLQPGPNNPVGTTWIALAASTFGIHGAPDPDKIGKTASHGCVRLTNWDASALGHALKAGTPVVFVGASG